jgi:hypothetical protein
MAFWDTKYTASPPTHTNLYISVKSRHHPSNKQVVLSTLIHRGKSLCDEDGLQAELVFLREVFKQNGYNRKKTHRALNHCSHAGQPENKPNSVSFLPFVGSVFNRINRVLARHNIKSVGLAHIKLSNLLHPVKDNLGLRKPHVKKNPCECGSLYWADRPLRGRQIKRGSTPHPTGTSRQVSRG